MGATGTFQEPASANSNFSYSKPIHRLYRDPNNHVIGGVCGGMGAYFNTDPVLFRICFVIGLFMGFGPIIYLVMWIAIPKANTVMQKLEMRGEQPTPENMRQNS
jgi:phage shock protein C